MRIDDLGWIVGNWRATVEGATAGEEIVSDLTFLRPHSSVMVGAWHIGVNSVVVISVRESDTGLEWHQRAFTSSLEPDPDAPMVTLELLPGTPGELTFESPVAGAQPHGGGLRILLRRTDPDGVLVRMLVPDSAGGWKVIRDQLHRSA